MLMKDYTLYTKMWDLTRSIRFRFRKQEHLSRNPNDEKEQRGWERFMTASIFEKSDFRSRGLQTWSFYKISYQKYQTKTLFCIGWKYEPDQEHQSKNSLFFIVFVKNVHIVQILAEFSWTCIGVSPKVQASSFFPRTFWINIMTFDRYGMDITSWGMALWNISDI